MTSHLSERGLLSAPSNASFPLTPALSLGERENRRQLLADSAAWVTSRRRAACLPLPEGEGRGEGEGPSRTTSRTRPSRRSPSVTCLCFILAPLLTILLTGCVSKSKADAQARTAYLAGQQEAIARMQQMHSQTQGPSIMVNGDVRNRAVPWSEGMTLAKALVAADYTGASDPAQIIVVHQGVARRIELQQMLSGPDIPLQPGDIIQLVPQGGVPKQ